MKGADMATASFTRQYVVRCIDPDCESRELLYTSDRKEAERTARELDWRQTRSGWLCPCCAPRGKGVPG